MTHMIEPAVAVVIGAVVLAFCTTQYRWWRKHK